MEHVKALAIKAVMTLAVLFIVLGLGFGVSFTNVVLITVVLGAVSYLAGDLYILPKTNNMTATAADAGVAFLVVWLMLWAIGMATGTAALAALISAVVMAIGEYFFHQYISDKDLGMNSGRNRRWETSSDH